MSDRIDEGGDIERWVDELKRGIDAVENSNRIYLTFRPWVFGFIKKRFGKSPQGLQDYEDLTQEVFAKVFQNLGSCKDVKAFRPWLFAIAANTVRTRLASAHREKRDAREESMETLAEIGQAIPDSRQVSAEKLILQKEREMQIRSAISELPEQMRQCMELHFFESYSYRQVAALLRIGETTVRVQIHNARARLKRLDGMS